MAKAPPGAAEGKPKGSDRAAKGGGKGDAPPQQEGEGQKLSEEDKQRALGALRGTRKRIYLELDKAKAEVRIPDS